MKKKGFTLIELLAVIVILAIIALIATPMVLKIINNSKTKVSEESVKTYLSAVELSLSNDRLTNNNKKNLTGKYQIIDNGKKIKNIKNDHVIAINYKGSGLESGYIEVKNGIVKKIKGAKIDNSYAAIVDGKIKLFDTLPESELIAGDKFSVAIKSLVSGETKKYVDYDEQIKSVEFFSYGKLPNNYSYEDLQKLNSTDVSLNSDNSIVAYHDGEGNVFVYSENLIIFNSNSTAMFYRMKGIKNIKFNVVDTSEVINFGNVFENCNSLETVDLAALDTSKVTTMTWLFYNCYSLTEIDLSNFDTSEVTNMQRMFYGCNGLTHIDVSNFNTENVTSMWAMFEGCSSLKSIDISNFKSNVLSNVSAMFSTCTNLEEIKLEGFNIGDSTSMAYMFYGCKNLKKLDLTTFDTTNVTNMNYMFNNCTNLTEITVSDKWVINDSTTTSNMFTNCGTNKVTLN